jgi:hypothetical protein
MKRHREEECSNVNDRVRRLRESSWESISSIREPAKQHDTENCGVQLPDKLLSPLMDSATPLTTNESLAKLHDEGDRTASSEKVMSSIQRPLYMALSGKSSIRLIKLIPRPEPRHMGGKLRCGMEEFLLQEKPTYVALSYTWGASSWDARNRGMTSRKTIPILCNGSQVVVTQNLHDCLERFEDDNEFHGQWLWVDALSINQEDESEKSSQIQHMGRIYREAQRVVAWLGKGNDNQRASRWSYGLDGLEAILGRLYFSRMWVIQEVILGREVIFITGDVKTSWETLLDTTKRDWRIFSRNSILGADTALSLIEHPQLIRELAVPSIWDKFRRILQQDQNIPLLDALQMGRSFDSTDARDKAYGILGICSAEVRYNSDLCPAYGDRKVAETYIRYATYIVNDSEDLRLLTTAESIRKIQELPSWVPDWSVKSDIGIKPNTYKQFAASGNIPKFASLDHSGRLLTVKAIRIDTVSRLAKRSPNRFGLKAGRRTGSPKSWESGWVPIIQQMPRKYHNGQSKFEAVWRTAILDVAGDPPMHPAPNKLEGGFCKWIVRADNDLKLRSIFASSLRARKNKTGSLEEYHEATLRERALQFLLTKRRYIGLAPLIAKEGDSIWIVAGCRIPLCLRPVTGSDGGDRRQWQLIGGMYIHSQMHGEALKEYGEEQFQPIVII